MKNVISHMEHELSRPSPSDTRLSRPIVAESATQIIAQGIINLSWREAEKMGEGIKLKMKDGESLTSAIQAWAAEWEKFSNV